MSKLDFSTIIIVALCVFALGFLIYKTVGLNKNGKTDATEQTTTIMSADDENDEYEYDDEGEIIRDDAAATQAAGGSNSQGSIHKSGDSEDQDEGMADDDASSDGLTSGGTNNNSSTATTSNGKIIGSTSQTAAAETSNTSKPTFYDDDSRGRYLVLAGAFRIKDNGIREASRLRRLGYSDAEMTLMDRGTYATVLVDRFSNNGEAKALVSELRGKGIESYVMTKK